MIAQRGEVASERRHSASSFDRPLDAARGNSDDSAANWQNAGVMVVFERKPDCVSLDMIECGD